MLHKVERRSGVLVDPASAAVVVLLVQTVGPLQYTTNTRLGNPPRQRPHGAAVVVDDGGDL